MKTSTPFLPATLFPERLLPPPPASAAAPEGAPAAAAAKPFSEVLAQSRPSVSRQVRVGDTLLGIVREQAAQRGVRLNEAQGVRLAQQVARDSGIADANRIFPGQSLALDGLHERLAAGPARALASQAFVPAAQVLGQGAAATGPQPMRTVATQRLAASAYATTPGSSPGPPGPSPSPVPSPVPVASAARAVAGSEMAGAGEAPAGAHPVLEQTLDRAVARGFIPALERGDVYDKILQLAARHRFKPDDFARLTLVESDGMNPRASNERCHGIIQFCDGNDRGAATAGFGANPRAILGFSVYQQLHLVDRYFSEVGVRSSGPGPAGLDDLYLAVLMPSARQVTDPQAPLGIPGTQASVLHPGRDRSAPITRQSLQEGLQQYASDRLASFAPRSRYAR